MTIRLGLGLIGALAATACAPTTAPTSSSDPAEARPVRQCFETSRVTNFRQGRPNTVYIRVGRDEVFEMDSAAGCSDLDFAVRLAIVPDPAGLGGGRVCVGDWARLIVPGSTSPASVCRAHVSRVLTEEQVAALPAAQRP